MNHNFRYAAFSADNKVAVKLQAPKPALPAPPTGCHVKPGKRILLVDDDPSVRGSLSDLLEEEGYDVVPAVNGQRALELIATMTIDLVLLDLNMPVKNGWDTFERLSMEYPLVPVMIITARPNQLFLAASAGVGALLEKPLDIPLLLRAIHKLLTESMEVRLARVAGRATDFYYATGVSQKACDEGDVS